MIGNKDLTAKLNAIRNGDKEAFDELYKEMRIPIYTIIFRMTGNKLMADEILQELFIKLYLSPIKSSIKNPRAYIFQMSRNLTIDSMRKQKQDIPLDEIEDTVHQPMDDLSLKIDIERALKCLSEEEREIVYLHITGDMKFREISEMMKTPLGTVLWRYHKAINKLKEIVEQELL